MPDINRLKEAIDYDPNTGIFTWKISHHRIRVGDVAGYTVGGYRRITLDRIEYKANRLAWFYMNGFIPDGAFIDHKDCDPLNNRIDNLRPANHGQNMSNGKKYKNGILPKGVCFYKRYMKYMAQIVVNKKRKHLGYFDDPNDAHAAYVAAARKAHGEFFRSE